MWPVEVGCVIELTIAILFLTWSRLSRSSIDDSAKILAMGLSLHPGFLILDFIHFQYNAFLFGIMIWSLVGAKEVNAVSSPFCS